MNQTAVEWIEQKLIDGTMRPVEIIAIAKAMEKEQIEKAFDKGYDYGFKLNIKIGEVYYNETYKNTNE